MFRAVVRDPALPEAVTIYEVGPRDGLQNESGIVPLDDKAEFITRLVAAGLPIVEATSFVHPAWVPQLADAAELVARLPLEGPTPLPVLVPNERGLDRALEAGCGHIAIFASATETFAQKNLNSTLDSQFAMFEPVVSRARDAGVDVRAYVSMCFGDPWEGEVPVDQVVTTGKRLLDLGATQLSIGDTIGVGTAAHVGALIDAFAAAGVGVDRLAMHFHDTYGQALANAYAALRHGITTFDASAGGLGGCPYAESATGNLATEDLVWMLTGLGIEHGVDLESLVRRVSGCRACSARSRPAPSCARWADRTLGRQGESRSDPGRQQGVLLVETRGAGRAYDIDAAHDVLVRAELLEGDVDLLAVGEPVPPVEVGALATDEDLALTSEPPKKSCRTSAVVAHWPRAGLSGVQSAMSSGAQVSGPQDSRSARITASSVMRTTVGARSDSPASVRRQAAIAELVGGVLADLPGGERVARAADGTTEQGNAAADQRDGPAAGRTRHELGSHLARQGLVEHGIVHRRGRQRHRRGRQPVPLDQPLDGVLAEHAGQDRVADARVLEVIATQVRDARDEVALHEGHADDVGRHRHREGEKPPRLVTNPCTPARLECIRTRPRTAISTSPPWSTSLVSADAAAERSGPMPSIAWSRTVRT